MTLMVLQYEEGHLRVSAVPGESSDAIRSPHALVKHSYMDIEPISGNNIMIGAK